MTDIEEILKRARREAAAVTKYALNRKNILRGEWDDKSSVIRAQRRIEKEIAQREKALEAVLKQIDRADFTREAGRPSLLERMRAQLHVWEDNAPEEQWDTVQREYAEAFLEIEQHEALKHYLASQPVPKLAHSLENPPF
jgi:hypothetical protein